MTRRKLALLGLGLLLIWAGFRTFERFHPPGLVVTFFDVGQGDGALLQFPNGATWVVDAGGGYKGWDAGRRVLYPELARAGILSLDGVVMSHPDLDHAGGILGLIGFLPIREIIAHGEEVRRGTKPLWISILRKSQLHHVPVRGIDHRATQNIGGVSIVWHPVKVGGNKTNNRSLVFEWRYGKCSGLFTGDIESEAEHWLFARVGRIDLLKVPHHGSKTSSTPEFLSKLQPRWAVMSAGEGNLYGHPHPAIVTTYRRKNIAVFRTDFHGYLRFTISPDGAVKCESSLGSCGDGFCHA